MKNKIKPQAAQECHHPRHGTPCPEPCDECATTCGKKYLRPVKPQAAKPSPLPWDTAQGANGDILITSPNPHGIDEDVAHVYGGNKSEEEKALADAALIVRAVNAHAGLVEALRRSLRAIEWGKTEERMTPTEHADMMRAALRAAGEAV